MKNDVTRRTVLAGAGTAALSATLLGSPFGARAQSPTYLNMGSTPSSSGHFAYWVSVGQSVEKGTDGKFVVNVMETNSSIDNARRLRRGEIEFGLSAADAVAQSYFGKGVFEKEGRDETIRQLWIYVGAPNIFVVRADAGVRTLADLDGKPYNAGIPGSSSEAMALATFKTLGIQPKLHKGSTGDAVNATRDGQIIGFHKSAASASTPDASFVELGATTDITVIPFKEDELAKVLEAYPYYSPITVPGGVYKGQDTDFRTTVVAPGGACTTKSLTDDQAYQIVKSVFEQKAVQEAAFPAVKKADYAKITMEATSAPLHAGAVRYFREIGVQVPDRLLPPEAR